MDSSTDPSGVPTSAPQPQAGNRDQRLPSRSSPGLALRDVGMIFSTIEQLTLKLNRLKDMELAHRELLKSLGGGSSGGTTPVGNFHIDASRWTDSSLSPPTKEELASDPRDSQEPESYPEDGCDTPLEDSATDTPVSPGL